MAQRCMQQSRIRPFVKSGLGTILVVPALLVATAFLTTCSYDQPVAPASTRLPDALSADVTGPVPVLIGAGNIARCDRTNDEATARLLGAYPDATVFTAGDNIYGDGSITDFTNCYGPSWGQYKARTRPAVGELDYKTTGAAGYFGYFGAAAAGDSAKYYYSYNLGAWHVVVLNDNISMAAGSAQEQWLRAELAASTGSCTLAYWHHPRFSSTGTNNLAAVKPLWDALYDYNADVVLNAHYNNYERFGPQNPAGAADANGVREFIVGTGGLDLQNPGGAKPNSQVRNGTTYGVLMLTLDTLSYSWQFLPIAGKTFTDTGSTACHTRVPVASVDVSPASASVQVGATVQLTATPKDATGAPLTGRTITWTSADTSIAKVDGNGRVTGKAQGGPVSVTATSEGKSGASAITVATVPVASIDVAPATATIQMYGGVQLTATPKDSNGNAVGGATIAWASSAPGVAGVSTRGYVVGVAQGTASITATSQGKTGTSTVTVQAASGPPVLVGAGDIADCSRLSQEATARLLDGIVGTVATFGDGAYENGSFTDSMNCYDPSWGRHKARTRPATGNHDYNFGRAAGAPGDYHYYGAAAGDSGLGYYSYDLGTWHITVINSSLDMSAGSPQEMWLRADLAAHPTTCALAYWHHPLFSSGGNGSSPMAQPVLQALDDYVADLVINGHDHHCD